MRTKINVIPVILFFLFAGGVLTGCNNSEITQEDDLKASTPVTITNVTFGPLTEYIELNANSAFTNKDIIRSTTNGILTSVEINAGDKVSKGQHLFTIQTKEAAALESKNISGDSLLHFKGVIKIVATAGGTVSTVGHQEGDYVQEGDELATIVEQGSLIFNLQAPYELSGNIHTGQACEIVLPDHKTIKGIIGTILPSMDLQAQTLTLNVKPLTSEYLPENLIAKVRIVKCVKKNACTLPKEAVLTDETQSNFWVMKMINDTVAVKVVIQKGIETEETVEIVQPVFLPTDRIILTGNYGQEDTAKVNIISK